MSAFFEKKSVKNDPVQSPPPKVWNCPPFFLMGSLLPNFKIGKLKLGKETQGKANKWEEIQFEFRLSDAQKGSFLGETENSR